MNRLKAQSVSVDTLNVGMLKFLIDLEMYST